MIQKVITAAFAVVLLSACASKSFTPSNKCGKECQEWLLRK